MSLIDPLEQFNIFLCPFMFYHSNLILQQTIHLGMIFFIFELVKNGYYKTQVLIVFNFIKNAVNGVLKLNKNIYLPFFILIFFFILISNLSGMVPVSYTSTSMLTVTLFISSTFFLATNYLGIYKHSYKFITMVVPINVPILIKPFLFLIETISYVSRVFSLAIRLFANMLSGHILVKIIVKSLWDFFYDTLTKTFQVSSDIYNLADCLVPVAPWTILMSVTTLETIIAFLQAYVFIVLSATYLNDAIHLH